MPCGSICPASDALCIAGFKQASACQPPTREICCIGPGIVDSWEKELYIMLDIMYIYMYIYIYISKYIYVYFEGLDKNHVMLTSFARTRTAPREVNPTFRTAPPGCSFSGNWAPISRTRGWKSSPDFRQNPSAGNRCPIWAARGGNRACNLSVASLCASN